VGRAVEVTISVCGRSFRFFVHQLRWIVDVIKSEQMPKFMLDERKLGDLAVKELMRSLMGNAQQGTNVPQWHPGFGSIHRKHHRCLTCLVCSHRSIYARRQSCFAERFKFIRVYDNRELCRLLNT
jgi:hypothetical protein